MRTIEELKAILKSRKMSYLDLSEQSGVGLNTIKIIFSDRTPTPRIDTMQAFERALGLSDNPPPKKPSIKLYQNEHKNEIIAQHNDYYIVASARAREKGSFPTPFLFYHPKAVDKFVLAIPNIK